MSKITTVKVSATSQNKSSDFDFDYWCNLAKKDPEAFEAARQEKINGYIEGIGSESTQERMRKLQWRVEMERKLSKNPMDAAIRIYDMMWESVGKNFEAIQELADHFKPQQDQESANKRKPAKVLKFKQEESAVTAG